LLVSSLHPLLLPGRLICEWLHRIGVIGMLDMI
jgi:hypothetical protein